MEPLRGVPHMNIGGLLGRNSLKRMNTRKSIGPNKIITGLNKSIEARCLKRFNFVLAEIPRLNKRDVKWTNDENKGSGRIKSARMRLVRPYSVISIEQQKATVVLRARNLAYASRKLQNHERNSSKY